MNMISGTVGGNLQPKGNKSKPYQVKQVRNVILKHKLGEK